MRIYLIGFMGAGKTHWGKIWAEQLQLKFIDLDEVVEKRAGLSIDEIFSIHGESVFRSIEQVCLLETADDCDFLCALGGGTPCHENNMEWINEHGISVWLDVGAEILATRIDADRKQRPLLNGKEGEVLLNHITVMLNLRKEFYQKALIRLEADQLHTASLTDQLNLLKS
jgi:shikimate kinase